MAIKFPDILEHNNPNYAIVDASDISGTFWRISGTLDNTNLLALPETKRGLSQVVFSVTDDTAYLYYGTDVTDGNWGDVANWRGLGGNVPTVFETEPTTARTLSLTDAYKEIEITSVGDCYVTVPNDSSVDFDIGTRIYFAVITPNDLYFTPDTGVTIQNNVPALYYDYVTLTKVAANTYRVVVIRA